VLFIGGGMKIQTFSTQDIEIDYPSTKGFGVSIATSSIHPSRKWTSTSMEFGGGRTSLPHQANKAFTYGCALKHTTTPTGPLPSYRWPSWKNNVPL